MFARWAYVQLQYPLVKRMIAQAERSQQIQRNLLMKKIHDAADTQFGRDHRFSSIRNVADFRKQVPIADFEYFRPYVDAVRNGRHDAMFADRTRLRMFAMTSGTTDCPKHIPVTDEFVSQYKRGWKLWGLQAHVDHVDLVNKDYVHLASDWQQSQTAAGIWCGNISGLAAETRPAIVRRPFLVPPPISKLSDWTNRQYAALRLSIVSPRVGMIITANPLTLVSIAKLADQHQESLLRDIHDGTLSLPNQDFARIADGPLRRRIGRGDKKRATELAGIVNRSGGLCPRDFWPQMSVLAMWTGGPMAAFVPEVRRLYGNCAVRDHGLSASEGRMTIPLEDESNTGMLDYQSNYYEFIQTDNFDHDNPSVLEANELEVGQSYYIILTNCGGLFRYNINDVVRCTGFQGQTPLLEFLHKGAHCTSMTGEKLTEYQVASAVRGSFADLDCDMETIMMVPVMGTPPRYVLLVEQSLNGQAGQLAKQMDKRLAEINCEYQDRIQTRRLDPISVRTIPDGSWNRLRDEKIVSQGGSQEQYKHAFLSTSDDILKQLMVEPSKKDLRGI